MNSRTYVIISAVRNEDSHLQQTIDSVAAQAVKPSRWIIVNDGSTDNTRGLVEAAAKQYPWIRTVHRPDRGYRKAGGGVIEAFYEGYSLVADVSWEYLVKLDGDLAFDPKYFASCFARFEQDPALGIGGGTICGLVNGGLEEEAKGDPKFHVRGATKIYRRACWEAIGELVRQPGWDTLDELKANMLGWTTYSFPELKLTHYRYTGGADGAWKNWVKNGRANYITGYHPLFMFLKCVRRLRSKPFGVASAGLCVGFLSGYFVGTPQVQDGALVQYVRQQQMNRLRGKKSLWD